MQNDLCQWNDPPATLQLVAHEVHVWRAPLVLPAASVSQLRGVLLPEEVARAERFYFERDRLRWTVARGVLRMLLGRYLGQDPRQLHFITNAYGKLFLEGSDLYFNISHSQDLALYAFTFARQLGVDVEYKRPDIDFDALAKHSFSQLENQTLQTFPLAARGEVFYLCWTRKEAYIKARGMGLSLPLDLFDVSCVPGEPAALLGSREDPQEVGRWSFRNLTPQSDYAGALVVEGSDWQLSYYNFSYTTNLDDTLV